MKAEILKEAGFSFCKLNSAVQGQIYRTLRSNKVCFLGGACLHNKSFELWKPNIFQKNFNYDKSSSLKRCLVIHWNPVLAISIAYQAWFTK